MPTFAKSALLLAGALLLPVTSASAFELAVTGIDQNKDGSATYHFALDTSEGETLAPGDAKTSADFVTIYNFYGLTTGSAKAPAGWEVTSEEFGRTPTANGYPMVMPLDVPNTPNLTFTVTKPVAANAHVEGFSATTEVATSVSGQYAAQLSRAPKTGRSAAPADATKQALIGTLPTPTFLAPAKT